MKRIIMVTGLPRSGTSMLAGCIERFGVRFFTDHRDSDDWQRGYYDDPAMADNAEWLGGLSIQKLIENRSVYPAWGWKAHSVYRWVFAMMVAAGDLSVVRIRRNKEAIERSLAKKRVAAGGPNAEQNAIFRMKRCIFSSGAIENLCRIHGVSIYEMKYEEVIENPVNEMRWLFFHIFKNDGDSAENLSKISEAACFVKKELNHE